MLLNAPSPRLPGSVRLNYLQVKCLGIMFVIKFKEILKGHKSNHNGNVICSTLRNCKCVVILALRKGLGMVLGRDSMKESSSLLASPSQSCTCPVCGQAVRAQFLGSIKVLEHGSWKKSQVHSFRGVSIRKSSWWRLSHN